MAYVRTDRVAEDIKKELSEMMRLRLRDPRLSEMASIVSVELARDFSHATVRVSVMGDEAAQKDSIKAVSYTHLGSTGDPQRRSADQEHLARGGLPHKNGSLLLG